MDLLSTSHLFGEFLAQRRYLRNVTPSTIEWYDTAFKALQRTHGPNPPLTRRSLQTFVVDLRERGVKPISCNTYIKALNAFCRWLHDEGHLPERLELETLRLEKRILPTLTDAQMQALLGGKPKTFDPWRLHALIALLLDTGVRIDEALTLRIADVDFDNLLLTVFGKGRKERRIPSSFELRKVLFRWQQLRQRSQPRATLVFPSRQGTGHIQPPAVGRSSCGGSIRGSRLELVMKLGLYAGGQTRLRLAAAPLGCRAQLSVGSPFPALGPHCELWTIVRGQRIYSRTRFVGTGFCAPTPETLGRPRPNASPCA